MPHSEARAWWADVQHLRDDYERTDEARRRADEADLAARRATRERGHVDAEVSFAGGDAGQAPRRGSDGAPFAPRRGGHAEGGPDLYSGRHVDLPPAPRVRQGIAPIGAPPRGPRTKGDAIPGRVTVEIRGRTVPAAAVPRAPDGERRRPPRRAAERVGARPDRVAMWALLMGLLLILVALGTADAPAVSALLLR
jgi:hypothetical protein